MQTGEKNLPGIVVAGGEADGDGASGRLGGPFTTILLCFSLFLLLLVFFHLSPLWLPPCSLVSSSVFFFLSVWFLLFSIFPLSGFCVLFLCFLGSLLFCLFSVLFFSFFCAGPLLAFIGPKYKIPSLSSWGW